MNRFLAIKELRKVIRETIPRLDSLKACDDLEVLIRKMLTGGLISDLEANEYIQAIAEMRKLYL